MYKNVLEYTHTISRQKSSKF